MRAAYLVIILMAFSSGPLFPQHIPPDDDRSATTAPGKLNINQDVRLDELVLRHVLINKEREGMQGYRIRIFSESGQGARNRATTVRANFFNKYPEIETYLDYDPPNFKVYVGDFRNRSEALKMLRKISRDYPYSFIVSDRINFPPLD